MALSYKRPMNITWVRKRGTSVSKVTEICSSCIVLLLRHVSTNINNGRRQRHKGVLDAKTYHRQLYLLSDTLYNYVTKMSILILIIVTKSD
jgi:hypothetical protein